LAGNNAGGNGMVFCRACGRQIHCSATACPGCGARQPGSLGASDCTILSAALLCFIFGLLGAHRFYVRKYGTAVLMIFTLGGLGLWVLIDFILILSASFTDREGHRLRNWV
jgi:hypothetical protein